MATAELEPVLVDEIEVEASICRESFTEFVKRFWCEVPGAGEIIWSWHMGILCDELQQVAERVFASLPREHDVVFNVSPGTSKTTIASILFPCWAWTRMPCARVISASHTDQLALDTASKARYVVKSETYRKLFPEIILRPDQDTKSYYANTLGGDRLTCTVGGKSPMGFHAHFLIVDDPIDPKKAVSELELANAKEFMTNLLPTRKVNKEVSVTFLIMQRLHREDPTAVMLNRAKADGAPQVRHICLPAELAPNIHPAELSENYVDGLMDPIRLSRRVLTEARISQGSYGYAGQFAQSPVPLGGGAFKEIWFNQRCRSAPYNARRVLYVDRAATADAGCYTAMVLLAKDTDNKLYVEHVIHGQWEPNERNDRIISAALKFRSRYGPNHDPLIVVEAERGSTGLESFQGIARRLMGFRVKEDQPTGSKDTRAEPWADQLAAKNVWLVEDGTWDVAGYIQEHVLFRPDPQVKRLGKFKDQVDASAGALKMLIGKSVGPALQVINLGSGKGKGLRLFVCSEEELPRLVIEDRVLLVSVNDLPRVPPDSEAFRVEGERRIDGASPSSGEGPPFAHLLGRLDLFFGDVDPAEHQDDWNESLPIMTRDHGKALWAFLLKKRDPAPQVIVFCDQGDRRAYALACGVADSLRLPRSFIHRSADPDSLCNDPPANQHAYAMIKASRSLVI